MIAQAQSAQERENQLRADLAVANERIFRLLITDAAWDRMKQELADTHVKLAAANERAAEMIRARDREADKRIAAEIKCRLLADDVNTATERAAKAEADLATATERAERAEVAAEFQYRKSRIPDAVDFAIDEFGRQG